MRKRRMKVVSLALILGLTMGHLPGTGAAAYAAEDTGSDGAALVQEISEEDSSSDTETEGGITPEDTVAEDAAPEETHTEEEGEADASEADASEETGSGEETSEETVSEEPSSGDTVAEEPETEASEEQEEAATEQEGSALSGAMMEIRSAAAAEASVAAVTDETKNGWVQSGDSWYYYVDGGYVTGWQKIKSKYYFFNNAGVMVTGFRTLDGATYYFRETGSAMGEMAVGWLKIDGYWYFFKSGKMLTGWQTISGETYYFNSGGRMLTSQWIGDLWLRDDGTATDEVFSREYMSSKYYTQLQETLKEVKDEPDIMKRVLKIAQSQEGYNNYATAGIDIEEARKNGYLWTGAVKRCNGSGTGNSEYTRWAQRYVCRRDVDTQYNDMHWCAIFSSWCLYHAGLYYGQDKKSWYYSYCADPRVERSAIITSFNCDQAQVWYTPLATEKIAKYAGWNTYVHTEVEPYDIPYRPGGLIFFCWDGDGVYFDHVGIVVSYDEERHVLRYISGNCSGQVKTYDVYYDKSAGSGYNYDQTIMAYAEYYEGREAWKAEDGRIRYYRNGKYLTGWQEIDGRTYYFLEDGERAIGFVKVGDKWYYMNTAGVLVTGWKEVDGKLYYMDENGVMATGKQEINGRTYYFASSGFLYKDGWWGGYQYDANANLVSNTKATWHKAKMGWWYGNSSWYAKDETLMIDGEKYSFDRSGYWIDPSRKIGWSEENGESVYYVEQDKKATGWKKIDGDWYYFAKDGYMRKNGWWQGYHINESGICTSEEKASWRKAKLGWWFGDSTGWYAADNVYRINDALYEFDKKGYLIED